MTQVCVFTSIDNYLTSWTNPVKGVFTTFDQALEFAISTIRRVHYTYSPIPSNITDFDREDIEEQHEEMPEEQLRTELTVNEKVWVHETVYTIKTYYVQNPLDLDLSPVSSLTSESDLDRSLYQRLASQQPSPHSDSETD